MKDIFAWLITSSEDPEKVSLMVKGVLLGVLPFIIAFTGIDGDLAGSVVGSIVAIVQAALMLLGAGMALYGGVRKIRLGRWSHPDVTV